MKKYLTINQVSEQYGLSKSYPYKPTAKGRLRSYKIGKRTLIKVEDIDCYMESNAGDIRNYGEVIG